jgi:hypothetical protein
MCRSSREYAYTQLLGQYILNVKFEWIDQEKY